VHDTGTKGENALEKLMVYSIAISIIGSLIVTPVLIPFLKYLKFGQSIREEGPAWHQKKSGTPTMGGISFIFVSVAVAVLVPFIFYKRVSVEMMVLAGSAFLFGIIGFIDDFIKVVMKRNLGLSSKAKFLMQIFVSVLSTVVLVHTGIIDGMIIIPFLKHPVDIGLFIIPLNIIVQLAVCNSANLTDGLDGLAASVTLIISISLMAFAYFMGNFAVCIFMAAISGALIGFLFFNWNPAKVFMGDTGSLFLGGSVAVCAIMLKLPIVLIIIAGVYLIETLSVIIQVTSFKLTGKRVFKMSPLHHHFEMCKISEKKIVMIFTLTTVVLCIAGYLSIINFC